MTTTTINPNYLPPSFYDASGNLTVTQQQAEEVSAGVAARLATMPPAQQELFLALLSSSDIAPDGVSSELGTTNLDYSLDRLQFAAGALERLATLIASDINFLARIMVEQAGEQRKDALNSRLLAYETAKANLEAEAGKLRDSAEQMLTGAITALVLTVVTAVLTSILAVKSAMSAGSAIKTSGEAGKATSEQAAKALQNTAAAQQQAAQNMGSAAQIAGQVGSSSSNTANQVSQSIATGHEAEGKEKAAEAQDAQQKADLAKSIQQSLDEMIKAIMNFLKELREAEVNQMQSLTRL